MDKNEPPPSSRDDPVYTVERLLSIVDELHKSVSPKMENPPSRVARSIPVSFPPLDINSDGDLFLRLRRHLKLIEPRVRYLQKLGEDVAVEVSRQYRPLENLLKKVGEGTSSRQLTKGMKKDIDDIIREISDLVGKLSVLPDKPAKKKTLHSRDSSAYNNGRSCSHLPGLYANVEGLTRLRAYRQVEQEFRMLEIERKICLLSFAVFPENREVHIEALMYWWIGEGILPVKGAEIIVREVLEDFTEKKLVEPVEERHKVAPSGYKMNPFVHSSVILISHEIELFDIYREGEKPVMSRSSMQKVCLVEGSSTQEEAFRRKMYAPAIETVFNASERNPEFAFKWFSNSESKWPRRVSKILHVFYLGRWERGKKRNIQIQNPDLMKFAKLMKKLRILSLQGISSFKNLKSSVCKLHKLIVLDLRECCDLTKLPEKIDSLQSLVYLDMTGCYMLEWIPMRLALLNNLEVLKGFVVSDPMYDEVACNLNYLKRLKKLRKLSIEIHRDDLSAHQLMEDLVKLKSLMSLRVTWRRDFNIMRAGKPEDSTKIKILPPQLQKLDLLHFPHETLPTWLNPCNLLHLKKLHIGGGTTLKGFGDLPEKATECAVEVLRLTSLPKLRVRWIELKQLYFPKLIFLEKFECPRVSLTPCDGNGIWRSDQDD